MSTAASDNSSLTTVLAQYADKGYTTSFEVEEGDELALSCPACGAHTPPSAWAMLSLRRLEGASDPDDMMAVVATRCPECAVRGTIVLSYGPQEPVHGDVLKAMGDSRGQSGEVPPHSAPEETLGDDPLEPSTGDGTDRNENAEKSSDRGERSSAMRDADTANGESPDELDAVD
jgi:hypothetical protein